MPPPHENCSARYDYDRYSPGRVEEEASWLRRRRRREFEEAEESALRRPWAGP